jgi:hypothetical protein
MGKLVLLLSFISLGYLLVGGLLFPDNSTMWLAATTGAYTILRLALMTVLLALMITNPPRNVMFRIFVGFFAVGMTVWSLTSTYQNHMQILDSASILAASVSMGIVALEYNYESEPIDLKKLQLNKRNAAVNKA